MKKTEFFNYSVFGKIISDRMEEVGISASKIARILDCSPQVIYKYRRGTSFPDTCMLVPLCSILDLNVHDTCMKCLSAKALSFLGKN